MSADTSNSAENTPTKITANHKGVHIAGRQKDKSYTVLVVEDSMPLRRMLCKILSCIKLDFEEAQNGKEALDKIQEGGIEKYSLIMCDLMMPGMDGATFITAAKKEYSEKMPPVLICSSRSDREAIQIVVKLGVAGYILKPFKTTTITTKVLEFFPELDENTE